MDNFLSSKKVIWIFGIIAALAIIATVVTKYSVKLKSGSSVADDAKKAAELKASPTIQTEAVADNKLPDTFPSDIPIEKGAKITSNYNGTLSDGSFQGTLVFKSAKSVDDNYTLYQNYFKSHNWIVSGGPSLQDQGNGKTLLATKDYFQAQVTINSVPTDKQNTVSITIVELLQK